VYTESVVAVVLINLSKVRRVSRKENYLSKTCTLKRDGNWEKYRTKSTLLHSLFGLMR
jgi:hypothetical protein